MVSRLIVVCLASGCGFQTASGTSDAGRSDAVDATADDAPADAAPPTACMTKWMSGSVQLTNPVQLTQLGSAFSDRDPFISGDNRRLYFCSARSGGGDVYVASRSSATDVFGAPVLATDLNTASDDSRISMTADERTLVIASDRLGTAGFTDLWLATRASTAVGFANFTRTPFAGINDGNYQLDPEVNADGTRVYFAYGFPQKIVVISRASTNAAFGPMVDFLTGSGDSDPAISSDERLILFANTRLGGPGGGDIWYTTRANATTLTLAEPEVVPAVNGGGTDADPMLSDDGCTLHFASNRSGNYEIYQSTVIL